MTTINARNERVRTIINKVVTESNLAPCTKASTQSRMSVIHTGINNSDLDSLSFDTLSMKFVDFGHSQWLIHFCVPNNEWLRNIGARHNGSFLKLIRWHSSIVIPISS